MKDRNMLQLFNLSVKHAIRESKLMFFGPLALNGIHAILLGSLTWLSANFFNTVEGVLQGEAEVRYAYIGLIILLIATLLYHIVNGIDNCLEDYVNEFFIGKFLKNVVQKCNRLNPIYYEDYNNLNTITKAKQGADDTLTILYVPIELMIFYIPYFTIVGIYLFNVDPILMLLLPCIFVPILLSHLTRIKIYAELADEASTLRRRSNYFRRCLIGREYFKEIRLYKSFYYFFELFGEALSLFAQKHWIAKRRTQILESSLSLLTLIGYGGIVYLLFNGLVKGNIQAGDLAAILATLSIVHNTMIEIICYHFGEAVSSIGSVRNYFSFLDLPEQKGIIRDADKSNNITLKNVSFKYPGTKKNALTNVSLYIKEGESVAIIGANGSGKTTLAKLMMNLYAASEGEIWIGKDNLLEVMPCVVQKKMSALFQDYQRYQLSLRDNIIISQVEKVYTDEQIIEILDSVSLILENDTYPHGLNTILSREFGGRDLSGGQWQRIAIARALYRESSIIFLDEPTSAIDPIEESNLYHIFSDIIKNRTTVLITHRLGAAKIADRIIVLNDGEIVELGSHNELLEKKGLYARMLTEQQKWYQS